MEIIRHDDGSLTVPATHDRHSGDDDPDALVDTDSKTMVIFEGPAGSRHAAKVDFS